MRGGVDGAAIIFSASLSRKGCPGFIPEFITLGANPAYHLAAHHAAFSASAFCKVQLTLRSCGSGVAELEQPEQMVRRNAARSSAWQALHLNPN
ncbi:MAG: hypothetical protein WA977_13540 [Halobacteriota archaeon]